MHNLVKAMIQQMARSTGTELTRRHETILEFAYDYYYQNKVGPLYHVLNKRLGVSKDEIDRIFPNGLHSVYSWVGIPIQSAAGICKPVAEVKVDGYREVYLDHGGTTYVRPEVREFLTRYFSGDYGFGNPSSSNNLGKQAYELIFEARNQVARSLWVSPSEIIFTSGGSEGNNMAIKGVAFGHMADKGHIIVSRIEHSSVLEPIAWLESIGFTATYVDVSPDGTILPDRIRAAMREDTILVCAMAANNEIGTLNPLEKIGEICADAGVSLMVDAVQAFGKVPLRPKEMGIRFMSVSGHKIYAPKGIGALFVDAGMELTPLIHGGGQEAGLRSGTENVPFIAAFGRATQLVHREMEREHRRLKKLQEYFIKKLDELVPGYILNGAMNNRLSNNVNVGFPDIDSGALQLSLNHIGVYVSSGAACSAGSKEESHVIDSLGVDTEKYGVIRFSFGLQNTREDLDYVFRYLPEILRQLRKQKNSPE